MDFDIVIVGGGPGGLAGALTLGRARRRVLVCDSGPRRNAAATHMHNFVTRDGTPPEEFRRIAREQLAPYPVELSDEAVTAIRGERGNFEVVLASRTVRARAILLCTGMVDQLPAIDSLASLWGSAVHICPYCHGWEVRDRRFGYLARHVERLSFAVLLKCWSDDVVVFAEPSLVIPPEMAELYAASKIRVETRAVTRLHGGDGALTSIELADGERVGRDILFMHPDQQQTSIVRSLGLALDANGFVTVNDMRETSVPGIYAAGDLVTAMQTAIGAAGAATFAAGMINHSLALDDARRATRRA